MAANYLITRRGIPSEIIIPHLKFILSSLTYSLSVSINLTILTYSDDKMSSMLIKLSLKKLSDLKVRPTFTSNASLLSHYDLSYPFQFNRDVIVTHRRGLMTPLEKMFNFYGWLTIAATVIIITTAFLVIYLSNNLHLSFSIFDSLRLIINVAITSKMDSTKSRIFFSMIFLYFLVIQATFSGHLAAFLTKPEYRKNVESLEDLKDPRYQVIYAHESSKGYITDESLLSKTIFGEYDCNINTIINPRAACITNHKMVNYLIAQYDLHQAKNPLVTKFGYLLLRKNWRLKDRVNFLIARIVDTGLNFKKSNFSGWKIKRYFKQLEERLGPNYYRPVELQDLLFIFVLLSVGLLVAILAFLGELGVQAWKDHQLGIRKRWRAAKTGVKIVRSMVWFKIKKWTRKQGKKRKSRVVFYTLFISFTFDKSIRQDLIRFL
ncbi:Protein of unknown function [Cotesia congregata]|uniref:Ionotropic glutamate receptor C-terminal domain-containing protein n=1 Tax=Cotesia congregata TaxID=51543 RepID=A0A8J2EG86_COTCN|nr:Protein of unknown function [Cotesia congregata]